MLARRGGAWFRSGTAELHLGVEDPFPPAKGASGLLVGDLDGLPARLAAVGGHAGPMGCRPASHARMETIRSATA